MWRFRLFLLGSALFVVAGCKTTTFRDLTRERIPENQSGIYTFEFAAQLSNTNVVDGTERAQIVINGETYEMEPSPRGERMFVYDYRMPPGVTEARYYYALTYDYITNNVRRTTTRYSTHDIDGVYLARLVNRYIIQLLSERGPVGSSVGLVGSGFSAGDTVVVDGQEVETIYHSPNSLEFIVPALPADRSYPVKLRTNAGDIEFGNFRIDEASFTVLPASLNLRSGERAQMTVQIPDVAPSGGLYVDVTTDAPRSVIMPEVLIPAGFSSVVVDVEGGERGSGTLFVQAPGFAPKHVRLQVD